MTSLQKFHESYSQKLTNPIIFQSSTISYICFLRNPYSGGKHSDNLSISSSILSDNMSLSHSYICNFPIIVIIILIICNRNLVLRGINLSARVLPKIMEPPPNQVAVIPYRIVQIGEPHMETLGAEEQHTEHQATQPGKTVDSWVHHQRVPKYRENPSR